MRKLRGILIIDDSEATNLAVTHALKTMGIAESIASRVSVGEAIAYFKDRDAGTPLPELILLDIEIGGQTGFDFLDEYERLDPEKTDHFKPLICMVSQHMTKGKNHDMSKRYEHIGVVEQLRKPLEPIDILEFLDEHKSHFE